VKTVNSDKSCLSLHNGASGQQTASARILVVGEVLWDRFPDSVRLGGAPLNVAVTLGRLKHCPLLISAVGTDAAGEEARRAIEGFGLDVSLLQTTNRFSTGSATIRIGPSGDVSFTINRPAAYDELQISDEVSSWLTAWNPGWLYYGTLFPSRPSSREALLRVLLALPDAARFYDLNLRPGFDEPDLIESLLGLADVVKLNEDELRFAHEHFGLPVTPEAFCRAGSERYGWQGACVTLGARGCALFLSGDYVEAEGVPVKVADTVGAGDAFAAAFLHALISGWPAAQIAAFSNRLGAYVASVPGAIPDQAPAEIFSA